MSEINCPHCGKPVNAESGIKFCPFCGKALSAAPAQPVTDAERDVLAKAEAMTSGLAPG